MYYCRIALQGHHNFFLKYRYTDASVFFLCLDQCVPLLLSEKTGLARSMPREQRDTLTKALTCKFMVDRREWAAINATSYGRALATSHRRMKL